MEKSQSFQIEGSKTDVPLPHPRTLSYSHQVCGNILGGRSDVNNDSWEWYWYEGQPSPMERVCIFCRDCKRVMSYHSLVWREATREDIFYARSLDFQYVGICPECYDKKQETENEDS